MGRLITASLLILLSIAPAWAQQEPLKGQVEKQDSIDSQNSDNYQPPSTPAVPQKTPSAEDLRPLQNAAASPPPTQTAKPDIYHPPKNPVMQTRTPSAEELNPLQGEPGPGATDAWSITIIPVRGMSLNSPGVSWNVEYASSRLHHEWDVWLSRVMHDVFQDCSRFKCPNASDHTCIVNIRRDGDVLTTIAPDGDVASTLFRNATLRLQGQQVIDFPPDSHQEKISIKLNLHYGNPLPSASIYKDAFGQPDSRYPLEKTYWKDKGI